MHGKLARGNLPLEACAEGSRFVLHMDFENLEAGELGLVLTALGLSERKLWPKLGGGKPACLGTIEVVEPQLTRIDTHATYVDFHTTPQRLEFAPLLDAAKELVLSTQLGKLVNVLRWPREDRECPDRNY
jgi:hypothetical protein